jgi:hypothetical protein
MSAVATAKVPTEKASRYLQQLSKHFAHKLPVTFDEHKGSIGFSIGECALTADGETLTITATSPAEADMEQLKDIIVRHLVRFAFREELKVEWQPTVVS